MARETPTEESMGLAPSEAELASNAAPDNDVGLSDDNLEPEQQQRTETEQAKPADPKPEDDGRTVDLRALQEARREAREARQQSQVLEQRWNDFLAGQQQTKQPEQAAPPAIPKFNEDPLAAGQWTQDQLVAMNERNAAQQRETEQRTQEERQFQEVFQRVDADYTAATQADPTIKDAYDALRESQGKELLAMGLTIPQAQAELGKMEREHIQYVASRGLNIGAYVKAMAEARGWRAGAPATQAAPQVKTDLNAVADAQQRHQSLSDAPGGEAVQPLDAKAIARMTDKQFKAFMESKGGAAKLDEIMGA